MCTSSIKRCVRRACTSALLAPRDATPPVVQIHKKAPLVRKQVDDVLGGEDAWTNVSKTDGTDVPHPVISHTARAPVRSLAPHARLPHAVCAVACSKCRHHQAFFMEVQIRSADEPATLFYKCTSCSHRWREG
jgi:DNA-directed RNA polymerase subunit M/transcription elongation factor TFIIS